MGHERVGALPHRRKWRDIIHRIQLALENDESKATLNLANQTLEAVRLRYLRLYRDKGVRSAFAYLVALSTGTLSKTIKIDLGSNPSPLKITQELIKWVDKNKESTEYAEMACRAAADTIADWTQVRTKQTNLFDDSLNAKNIWQEGIDGRVFCSLSRAFFANLTERYLKYFICREASAETLSIEKRDQFDQELKRSIQDISRHAFETSEITQSFAAGWYNKRAKNRIPSDKEISNFLSLSFSKLQEELRRESIRS